MTRIDNGPGDSEDERKSFRLFRISKLQISKNWTRRVWSKYTYEISLRDADERLQEDRGVVVVVRVTLNIAQV